MLYSNSASFVLLEHWGISGNDKLPEHLACQVADIFDNYTKQSIAELVGDVEYVLDFVPMVDAGYINIYAKDVTLTREMLDARIEAAQARDLMKQSVDAMAQGLLVHDAEKIITANAQVIKMLEIPEELVEPGKLMADFISFCVERGDEGEDADLNVILRQSEEKCRLGEPFMVERRTPNGSIIVANVQPRENGGSVSTYTDVTESRKRESELEKAQHVAQNADRAKSEFLANMSHEIRTPMNGVMGMAELLSKTELDAKQSMFTDVIVKSGSSLLTIINDILDFSKIDAGQMELDPAPFRLLQAIEDVATLVSSKVAEKDLELIVRVDPDLPEILVGDVGRIRQIVTNLMGNAVKFTEQGHVYVNVDGTLAGEGEDKTARLKFSLEDTGIGIPKEDLDKVFEKFNQVDTSSSRKHEGTGLGLSIASSLVELMDGRMGVESVVGSGSTFWFEIELPVHAEQGAKKRIPVDVTGSRILIVDDNEVNRSILLEQMASWQFESAAAVDGTEALAFLKAASERDIPIDCVIMDYHMPDMNGGDAVKAMRAHADLCDIPVVMLTSVDETEDGRAFSSLDIQGHLTKPSRSSLLLETVIQVLQNELVKRQTPQTGLADTPDASVPVDSKPDTVPPNPETGRDLSINADKIDILVCEDNEVNQIVFTQILQSTGYRFQIANNGKEGLILYKNLDPALILMDVSMPLMNGLVTTSEIRKMELASGRHTPIIGVTAHAIKGDMEKCLEAGMDDYLAKPVSPNLLEQKIRQWISKDQQSSKQAG